MCFNGKVQTQRERKRDTGEEQSEEQSGEQVHHFLRHRGYRPQRISPCRPNSKLDVLL